MRTIDRAPFTRYSVTTSPLDSVRVASTAPAGIGGAPFYMYDQNGDGRMDSDKDGVSPVYWKLYSW